MTTTPNPTQSIISTDSAEVPKSQDKIAVIKTNKGTMKVVLFPKIAPNTVANFVELSKGTKVNPSTGKKVSERPFYDGVIFHRIIKGFMIQGGDPNGTGMGGPGYKFADEPVTEEYTKGTIAMANSGPNTNGSQFFIMNADYPLPKNYTIFGRIDPKDSESLAVLDKISETPVVTSDTGESSKPTEKVSIDTITIEE
jgi:cyclophilin family peptidyl-prolyl cis-trans isomerase